MTKVLMIGGPGTISRGTLDYLQEQSVELAIFTRNSQHKQQVHSAVRFYEGDRSNSTSLRVAFEDFGADLVIDTICYERADAEALYEIVSDKIRHLIFLSSVDTYGYPLSRLPFTETDTFAPPTPGYAANKRSIEIFYTGKYQQTGFPVTIGRPSLSIGPDFNPMMFLEWGRVVVPRIKAMMPILVPGDGNGLMHVGWGYDVGRMIGRMIGDDRAVGKSYTLSAQHCITRDDYISLYTATLGVDPERVYIPQDYLDRFPGVDKLFRIPHLYRFNMAFSLQSFSQDFPDYHWLPLRQGVEEYIAVNEHRKAFADISEPIIDDLIIAEWKKRLAGW